MNLSSKKLTKINALMNLKVSIDRRILIFILLSLPLLIYHEPWGDEAQAWLIVRDIATINDFVRVMGYEGTPPLLYCLLFPLVKLEMPFISMALLHFVIALAIVVVFVSYAPFSQLHKTLFIFGYFIFYEYSIITRSYSLSVLLLLFIACIYKNRFHRPIVLATLILLLVNTNVHSLALGLVLSTVYIIEVNLQNNANYSSKIQQIVATIIIVIGIAIAIYHVFPPEDLGFFQAWNFDFNTKSVLRALKPITTAFVPLPYPKVSFWNSLWIYYSLTGAPHVFIIFFIITLSLILFLLTTIFFLNKRTVLVLYLLMILSLLSIFTVKHAGLVRHHGLIFISFIICLWIGESYKSKTAVKQNLIRLICQDRWLKFLLTIFLVLQIAAVPIVYYYEIQYNFSSGRAVAKFLKNEKLLANTTFISSYPTTPSILPYMPRNHWKFFYTQYNKPGSFSIWNKKFAANYKLPLYEIMNRIEYATKDKNYENVLLIMPHKIAFNSLFYKSYKLIAAFENTIVAHESFYIYKRKKGFSTVADIYRNN